MKRTLQKAAFIHLRPFPPIRSGARALEVTSFKPQRRCRRRSALIRGLIREEAEFSASPVIKNMEEPARRGAEMRRSPGGSRAAAEDEEEDDERGSCRQR